jgi:pyruvate formate lyase activating enzyme
VVQLDAIERKPLYHVRPGSRILTVAAPGCTFRCTYCINHRLSQYGHEPGLAWHGQDARPAELVASAAAHQAAVGLSYTEPTLAIELTLALAQEAAPAGIPLVWKTNGFLTPQALALVAPVLTAVNIDVKAAGEAEHRRLTGAPLAPVLDAVEGFLARGVWVEVSTPLIPGISDSPDALRTIAAHLAGISRDLPWHLVRFTPDHRLADPAPTSPGALAAGVELGRAAGLRHVYVERALGEAGRRTSCPSCGRTLVDRAVWALQAEVLADGRCPSCSCPIPGLWR